MDSFLCTCSARVYLKWFLHFISDFPSNAELAVLVYVHLKQCALLLLLVGTKRLGRVYSHSTAVPSPASANKTSHTRHGPASLRMTLRRVPAGRGKREVGSFFFEWVVVGRQNPRGGREKKTSTDRQTGQPIQPHTQTTWERPLNLAACFFYFFPILWTGSDIGRLSLDKLVVPDCLAPNKTVPVPFSDRTWLPSLVNWCDRREKSTWTFLDVSPSSNS